MRAVVFWRNCQVSVVRNPGPRDRTARSLPARRMTAHWVVLAAAALTTLVAAAVGAALAVFAGQALPQAVRARPGGRAGHGARRDRLVRRRRARRRPRRRCTPRSAARWPACRSASGQARGPIHLAWFPERCPAGRRAQRPGTRRCSRPPRSTASRSHAVLVAGRWPRRGPRARRRYPPLSPRPAPRCCTCAWGTYSSLRTGDTSTRVTFTLTGLYAQRQLQGAAASYWQVNSLPASGSSTESGFITYGPLLVPPSAFTRRAHAGRSGTWGRRTRHERLHRPRLSAVPAANMSVEGSLTASTRSAGSS